MKLTNNCLCLFIFLVTISIFSNSCKQDDNNTTLTVKDIDGNVYHTVTIGTQTWMVENLKTTKYNDSTAITFAKGMTDWGTLSASYYCWYDNDIANKDIYGALYNWNAINNTKLCPPGWHVPSDAEWAILITFLGGENIAGNKLKESGTIHWLYPNAGANNNTGFTALPGGSRSNYGTFFGIDKYGVWWSSSLCECSSFVAWNWVFNFETGKVDRITNFKGSGLSVRCIKD